MNGLFSVKLKDIAGAVVSGVIVAILGYLSTITNVTDINIKDILNISILTAITSLLKAFSTDNDGRMLGGWEIK